MQEPIELSVVLPCLDEEATLCGCLTEIEQVLASMEGVRYECILADNGSRDRSPQIAAARGWRCVQVLPQGYGMALQGGIRASRGAWVVFADADGTYCLEDLPKLYERTRAANADLGIASRFGRRLPLDAMPWLHRYLGTPVLSCLIRMLFGGRVRDVNSGFRCLHRARFHTWDVSASGMEFASETVVAALCNGGRIVEVPSSLRPPSKDRVPFLSTWRDGMRHLLVILSHAPGHFEKLGISAIVSSLVLQVAAALTKGVSIGRIEILGIHSQLLFLGLGIFGTQLYATGCFIQMSGKRMTRSLILTRRLSELEPTGLLAALIACGMFTGLLIVALLIFWATRGFHGINVANWLVLAFELLILPALMGFLLLGIHLARTGMAHTEIQIKDYQNPKSPCEPRGY